MFNLLAALQEPDPTVVENDIDFSEAEPSELKGTIDGLVDQLSGSSQIVTDPEVFAIFQGLLNTADSLPSSALSSVVDAISSAFEAEVKATISDANPNDHTEYRHHKAALEHYIYLMQRIVYVLESRSRQDSGRPENAKKTKRGRTAAKVTGADSGNDHDRIAEIPGILDVVLKALNLNSEFIWQTTQDRDAFVNCCTKIAFHLSESDAHMKIPLMQRKVLQIICIAAKNHGQAYSTQTFIMQQLQYFEHLSEVVAELVYNLSVTFDMPQIADTILRDIANKQFSAQDTKGPRSFSRFLVKLASLSPRIVLKQIVFLQIHLDSEAYPMRNGLLEVVAKLIQELSNGMEEGTATSAEKDTNTQLRQIEGFWNLLFMRFADSNTYVRSKVVSICEDILSLEAKFPQQRLHLARLAARSLQDKSSQVRKHCIGIFIRLILTHPYGLMHGGELNVEEWRTRYAGVEKELNSLETTMVGQSGLGNSQEEDEVQGTTVDEQIEAAQDDEPRTDPEQLNESQAAMSTTDQPDSLQPVDGRKLSLLRLQHKYYSDAISFIEILERAIPQIQTLLASKVKSEVLESISFFRVATSYKVVGAHSGVRRMLHLVWSKDNSTVEDGKEVKGVRFALLDCYRDLYFSPKPREEGETPVAYAKRNIDRIARNLIELTYNATLAELTSLEQLLGVMMEQDEGIHENVIAKLWQVYSTESNIGRDQRRGSIIILGMLAAPRPDIVGSQLDKIISVGLGPIGKTDLVLAKYSCTALRRLGGSDKKVKGSLAEQNLRLPMSHTIFQRLSDAIQNSTTSKQWFAMAEQAINTIYSLGDQPDKLCSEIIKNMTKRSFGARTDAPSSALDVESQSSPPDQAAVPEATQTQTTGAPADAPVPTPFMTSAFVLSQAIFLAGHCAVKQLLHLELIERELKCRKVGADKNKTVEASNEELEQVVGNVEDDIGDIIAHTREKELLYGPDSLLAVFGPMTVQICGLPKAFKNPTLRRAAILSLCKFMCVSTEFCEQHLLLLFKVLETSQDPSARSNIVIALGDLAVCFSNIMDQNSDRLYAGLTDRDLTVKKNTLMVLTHLILNGMIKVKGQLGEMAKCLQDDEERMSDLARLFFTELSTKDNAIYNNLPDIISHLSVGRHAIEETHFRSTMTFIFTFLEKERQAEAIIEKLCQRFRLVTEPRQWQDIAFCLSLLPYKSENTMKKLVDGLPLYRDKLHEGEVYKCFEDILVKARNNRAVKNESDLAEFEAVLEQYRAKGAEDAATEDKVRKQKAKGKAGGRRRGGKAAAANRDA